MDNRHLNIKMLFRILDFEVIILFILALVIPLPLLWAAPPIISVTTLFSELIISDQYDGWTVKGTGPLTEWPRTGLRQKMLTEMNQEGTFILTYPLTEKPVQVSEENTAFFSDLLGISHDGTHMALKYVFLPKSIMTPESQDSGTPYFFYLVKEVTGISSENVEYQSPPSPEEIALKIKNIELNHLLYHSAMQFFSLNEQDHGTALMLASAEGGNPQAQYEMGRDFYSQGNFDRAIHYFKDAADQGSQNAQSNYAELLYKGQGTPEKAPNFVLALEYFRRAADQGCAVAQNNYALMLRKGQGIPSGLPNLKIALEYYRRAADQGIKEAQDSYAWMLRKGEGIPGDVPDLKTALEYFRRAANQGYVSSQIQYAKMLQKGEGTPGNVPNLVAAQRYYLLAAAQGNKLAIQALREMNEDAASVEDAERRQEDRKRKPG